jgi:hypothetical protein
VEEIDCPVCKLNLSIETIATHNGVGNPPALGMSYSPALPSPNRYSPALPPSSLSNTHTEYRQICVLQNSDEQILQI